MNTPILGQGAAEVSGSARRAFWPDKLTDTPQRRRTAARRRLGHGRGLLPRLLSAAGHELVMLTVPLRPAPPAALYCPEVAREVRAAARAVLGKSPGWVKLERGRRGLLHLHILTAAAVRDLPPGVRLSPVPDPLGALVYLSKPGEGLACRWQDERGRWQDPTPAELEAATLALRTARRQQSGPLRRLSWTLNLPRM